MNHVNDFYNENDKTQMKETKENTYKHGKSSLIGNIAKAVIIEIEKKKKSNSKFTQNHRRP